MSKDNGWVLSRVKNGARFIMQRYEGDMYYRAANRAARRLIRSNKFQNLGIEVNLELNAFS